jgi:hypothetical protein
MIGLPSYLWKRLIIPLVFFVVIFFILTLFLPWQGFFVNLTTTFVGILVTVLYVDYVIKQHKKSRWAQAKALIEKRIMNFANVSTSQFRIAFGISHHVLNMEAMDINNPSSIQKEMIRLAQNILLPSVDSSVQKLNTEDWKKLISQLKITCEGADKICSVFGNRIEPEKLSLIIEIQDEIWSIVSFYTTFPDVIGVPDDKLPTIAGQSAISEKKAMEKAISEKIVRIPRDSGRVFRRNPATFPIESGH